MSTRIGNVKVTQKGVLKNYWKLNRYQNAKTYVPSSRSDSPSVSPSVSPSISPSETN